MPKVSVIVPIYNTKDYLEVCLESILSQDFQDFELILIDDGSTDGSEKICDNYLRKDSRINVLHIKNRGVSRARNIGLEKAKGSQERHEDTKILQKPLKTSFL